MNGNAARGRLAAAPARRAAAQPAPRSSRSPHRAAPAAAAGPTPAPNGRRVRAGGGARPDRDSRRYVPSPAATSRAQRPPAEPRGREAPRSAPRTHIHTRKHTYMHIHTHSHRQTQQLRAPPPTHRQAPAPRRGAPRLPPPAERCPPSAARRGRAAAREEQQQVAARGSLLPPPSLLLLRPGEAEEKRRAMSAESAHVPGPLRAAHRSAALRRLRGARPPAGPGARARQLRAVRAASGLPRCSAVWLRGLRGPVWKRRARRNARCLSSFISFSSSFFNSSMTVRTGTMIKGTSGSLRWLFDVTRSLGERDNQLLHHAGKHEGLE